jgi:putative endonuclease
MAHMYILECSDGTYYTGSTINLERRLWEHQNGLGANHTRKRLPVTLVYCEFFDRVSDAFYREKQVQGWTRRKKEALIASDISELHKLAICQNESHYKQCNQAQLTNQLIEDICSTNLSD